ncbi:amino acid ABC transporter permease [Streptomyces sp. SID14478]|uniref:amino acid ABC transporter permease n=1 Tax=Streptomyces sp. SID14478 TaxID=2706073 RepID=UPI0013DD7188|nr:amino acid ABC transporter permease [Streptomyces sp. SID14478]NEB73822.1 amino acid ABC transporter permease [Streptomyces sp. SID14478]
MAWDEWEQLKADAAERHTTQMQLNSTQGDGGFAKSAGGGVDILEHSRGPWASAARTSDDLHGSTTAARSDLAKAHDGMGGGLEGLASITSVKAVSKSWQDRLGRVRDECRSLEPKLRQVAIDLGEADAEVSNKAKAVTVPGTRRGE